MIFEIKIWDRSIEVLKNGYQYLRTTFPFSILYCSCPIYNSKGDFILKYSLKTLIVYNKYKIIENNLKERINIIRKGLYSQKLQVNNDVYDIKFAFFSHTTINCCNIYLNDKKIATVNKKYWNFPPHKFEVLFNIEEEQKQFYALIELIISLTLFDQI